MKNSPRKTAKALAHLQTVLEERMHRMRALINDAPEEIDPSEHPDIVLAIEDVRTVTRAILRHL